MSSAKNGNALMVTGASGFLGSLVAATALRKTDATVVLPLRNMDAREPVVTRLAAELTAEGQPPTASDLDRIVTVPLPGLDRMADLEATARKLGVTDILHCAGCLSYFNVSKLQAGNIDLTRALLSLGQSLGVRRFAYLSTAYSCGFVDGPIHETLHETPGTDPTDYTRTKREAEWMVARSGLPWVIVRPSIVIGDARDGRYGGKPYGVYQLWTAGERYLAGVFPPVLHVVAAEQPVNFLHQDAFTNGFWAAYEKLPDGSVVHLASRDDGLPSMRDLWKLWVHTYGGPGEVHFYPRLDDVPVDEMDPQLRLWLDFTAVNNEIASVRWDFKTDTLQRLRGNGLDFRDVTLETVKLVQSRFVADSENVQAFVEQYRTVGTSTPRIVVH